jgi:hypothetical protein
MQIVKIWKRATGATTRLSFLLFFGVLLPGGIAARRATAQASDPSNSGNPANSASPSNSANPAAKGWGSAGASGEVTVLATIRQVVQDHVAGTPAGLHILVDGPLGSFDASLGSYLSSEVREALSNGTAVQITGVVRSANGKDYLFARLLKVGGHEVVIRNANGFLVRTPSSTGTGSNRVHSAHSAIDGGIR